MWESIKSILSLNESPQRKIGRLSEERTKLQQQRDGLYELIEALEKKEVEVTANFAQAIPSAQQRIATEVAQLRSEIERRHQLLGTIDKKIGIVSSGIHQLEMARQVSPDSIKELEEVAGNTEDLEEGLASLDSLEETADAVTAMGSFGPSQKVQDVLAELRAKTAGPVVAPGEPSKAVEPPRVADAKAGVQKTSAPPTKQSEPRRSEPEAG
jgi:DNA repair exonuclease SbcCD ATPase subunit